ncbi:myocyte-specific enhancer factor 2A isoform X2 [Sinocyclocheilus grahami]|uniref:myocyte-specific enhancer factor 2A isoform X1 n=1 Tax=Sinocyclocheilus grahami TaxID=75366 RepID=UPI0007ACADB5|nr:PREDICTED: myocyte-specific enhancer factor 2A-like isoform X1 [Sinocyclocheilus grahami]XP_016140393.1 PREDICTED: myocyte-specific enhancer factor 2A-like isoform X2 [Sinocyclocheilus grahami]XP_016140394.1 PREDICTED: myocyte-specific enhancer factor 2A-like isoform X2 [Sinocyclocheilus grahami]XP_016140395.1 PREDICTED: myocyte-specific enhancer factor 2A-like isoform X2 [Sinocyclocheilus grahami]
MGRKKIQITRIMDERNRQVTFTKRRFGLMKKAYELSVLCDCEIALIIFNRSNKLFQYASTDMDKVLLKYTEYNEPHESRTNSDIVEVLNKKEQRACDSPDPEASYVLTPHTEEKYQKINEEFDNMMRNHKIPAALGQQSYSIPLTLTVTNPTTLSYSTDSSLDTPVSLSGANILSLSSNSLQSNNSTAVMDGMPGSSDVTLPNGVHSSHVANVFVGSSEGNRMGRVVSANCQASSTVGRKPDLRVLIPPVCKGTVSSLPQEEGKEHLQIDNSQSSQSLTTPVVSVATPSLHPQGLVYSAMTSSFSTDFALSSTELSSLHSFSSPDAVTAAPGSSWKHSQHGQPGFSAQRTTRPQVQASDSSTNSISIKSEPISPPRERAGHSIYPTIHTRPRPNSRQEVGRSPAESFSSSGSSYEGSDREDQRLDSHTVAATSGQSSRSSPETENQEDPSVKRMRTESWVT